MTRSPLPFAMLLLACLSTPLGAAEMRPLTAPLPALAAGPAVATIAGTPLNLAAIESLPLFSARMETPWSPQGAEWVGVRLAEVLAVHGLSGRTVVLRARDDYAIRLDAARVAAGDPLLATRMDGRMLDPDGTGPLMLVWPGQAEQVMARTVSEDGWIWGVVEIKAAP